MNNKQLKSQIREQIRNKRKTVSASENSKLGFQLNQRLNTHSILKPYQHIACFLSFDGEISTKFVIQNILESNKLCYLPKLSLKTNTSPNKLLFLPYNQSSNMIKNHYGIPEVDLEEEHSISIEKLDLVLFPLVAFDLSGNRLGMGGGFYDATFEAISKSTNRPKFIGLAHDFQQIEIIPKEVWDLPLDGVCTPTQALSFN
ncbi:MAG: 5-formyltetrahydrofolate cyclo-ligase [Gammaproteobacteria bacterium]|nr:MAG: 5-formyltetrahydrofolate cyclo-ligase [Gammaproteobacteria bacterium]